MDLIDLRMQASDLLVKIIKEGKESGLTKKKAVLRAHEIVKGDTGFDLSDAIPKEYYETYVPGISDDIYAELVIDAIKASIKAKRKPTIKAIIERKKYLSKIDRKDLMEVIINLIDAGEIIVDDRRGKRGYYLINHHDRYKLPKIGE